MWFLVIALATVAAFGILFFIGGIRIHGLFVATSPLPLLLYGWGEVMAASCNPADFGCFGALLPFMLSLASGVIFLLWGSALWASSAKKDKIKITSPFGLWPRVALGVAALPLLLIFLKSLVRN